MPQIEGVCIGGCKHGQWIVSERFWYKVLRTSDDMPVIRDHLIPVPMTWMQQKIAGWLGIPTAVDRPIEQPEYIIDEYEAHEIAYFRRGIRFWVFLWTGLDKNDPSIPEQAMVFWRLREQDRKNRQKKPAEAG